MSENLRGIVGAPTTPFNSDNKVDLDLFAKQVNFLIESGISLLAHPMHIGESLSMSEDERKDLARTLVEAANGRVPTFVHVSSAGTDNSIAMAEHSAKVGSTGIVLLAPYYWRPTDEYIIEHFRQVTKAHGGKFIAYNNPNATNVVLTPEIISLFIDELPGLVAIKDATYTSRLDFIEGELTAVDERLDTAEEFRLNISSDLAEIKTDLMWIRKQLQENANNIRAIRNEDRN